MSSQRTNLLRRTFLSLAASGIAAYWAKPNTASAQLGTWPLQSGFPGIDEQHLWIRQTGRTEAVYTRIRHDDFSPDANGMADLSWLFRDWRGGDVHHWIDPGLFDLLASVQTDITLLNGEPIELVLNSGYRTPRRNATIEGAAANSQHIYGRAADITVSGVSHKDVRASAEAVGTPGLGRYASFTHLDVGPPGRRWRG